MARLFDDVPTRALAIYAHPDDADVACGGTLSSWSKLGAEVRLLVLADGAKGTHDPDVDLAALAARRSGELQDAAGALGIAGVEQLGVPDGEVANDLATRRAIVAVLRRLRPSIVLAPDPTATFFGGVYVNHHDHREAGWAVLDSVAPASGMPHYFPETGAPHVVSTLLLSGTLDADVVVDIDGTLDAKIAAVLSHRSQLDGDDEWARSAVTSRAVQAGRLVGVTHGEAFRHVALDT
ncbi:MAG TPA: PIG-L family deacetylase [Acidimicrobiales bacterium]|jgi:LmbE family N-acetylglucosaminyl deacetylase